MAAKLQRCKWTRLPYFIKKCFCAKKFSVKFSHKMERSPEPEKDENKERRRAHTVAADEESPDGSSETGSKNDDLESYLMSLVVERKLAD